MNAHHRTQGRKAQARVACSKDPQYEQEYGAAYQGHGSTMPSRPHYSESPTRKGATGQSRPQLKGDSGSDYGLQLALEREAEARARRTMAGSHVNSNSRSKYLNTGAHVNTIDKVNPYLYVFQNSQEVHKG